MKVGATSFCRVGAVVCLVLALVPALARGQGMRKGPYLVFGGNNREMMVRWQVIATETCTIEWGTDTTYSGGSAQTTELGADHQHEYVIQGLSPGAHYFYRVTDPDTGVSTGDFRAAPPATASKVTFFAFGDTHGDRTLADFDRVCGRVSAHYGAWPDWQTFILHSGDWTSGDAAGMWDLQFFSPYTPNARTMMSEIPIQGCIGNHDDPGVWYESYWPYPYVDDFHWSFDYGPVHVAVIDEYVPYDPGSEQYAWLENDLATSSSCFKILLLHEPGWGAGAWHPNTPDVQNYLQPLCERYQVSAVVAGHNHNYARAVVNGVHHITVGGGGAPVIPCDPTWPDVVACASAHHFGQFDIWDDMLHFQAEKVDGVEIDSFWKKCGSDLDLDGHTVASDSCAAGGSGDHNGAPEPGETVLLSVTLANTGRETATGVHAVLSSNTPGVWFAPGRDAANYPEMAPTQNSTGDAEFVFFVDPDRVACGERLNFQIDMTYTTSLGVRTEAQAFSVAVPDPCTVCAVRALAVGGVALASDSCATGGGDTDGRVDPGEHASVRVVMVNNGTVDATNITATVTSPEAMTQSTATLPLLAAGATGDLSPAFEFDVDRARSCGATLNFDIALAYDQGTSSGEFTLTIPTPCTPCPLTDCRLGTPDRVAPVFVTRNGSDVEFRWTPDAKAEGGYHLFMSLNRADIPFLRSENSPPMPGPFLEPPAAPAFPVVFPNGVREGGLYYQVLGVCGHGLTEGPN